MSFFRAILVSGLLLQAGAAVADETDGVAAARFSAGMQIPVRVAKDPVLGYLPALLPQPRENLTSDQSGLDEVVTVSTREFEIRHLLSVFLEQSTATVRRVGGAFLPEEPQPGLQFRIDPATDEVYVGWRFKF